ncbi:MAG: molybdopterin molybdotransferase MoeA [candidate division Zixibacteria bacterium]|nr:molybdopterin molybdotransferase MoeA [candidate division Zixibacteria bacterium]
MITYKEAINAIIETVPSPIETEVSIEDAAGYVASREIISAVDVVNYKNSAMDGFAVKSDWFSNCSKTNPVTFSYTHTVFAGDSPGNIFQEQTPAKIMTGAPVPDGYDSVVKFEDTKYDDVSVTFFRPVKLNANVRFPGEDIQKGRKLFMAGHRFSKLDIGILAGIGLPKVHVFQKPTLRIATTGNEIVSPGKKLGFGQLYNSNLYTLMAFLRHLSRETNTSTQVSDSTQALEELFKGNEDVIITSGGVSAGERDFVVKTAEAHGWETVFHKIKIKPGKPVYFARRGRQLLFGLPGNPLSIAVTCAIFVIPALRKLIGREDYNIQTNPATLEPANVRKSGRYLIWPGKVEKNSEVPEVSFSHTKSSACLTALMNSDGLIFQPALKNPPDSALKVHFAYWDDILK